MSGKMIVQGHAVTPEGWAAMQHYGLDFTSNSPSAGRIADVLQSVEDCIENHDLMSAKHELSRVRAALNAYAHSIRVEERTSSVPPPKR